MSLILFPAIDLKDGAGVRLARGDMAAATLYAPDPVAQACAFAEAGAPWLHVVDLNGAFTGHSVNGEVVRAIRRAVSIPIQLGGGIRTLGAVSYWLEEVGIDRVILGSAAVKDPALVRAAARRYPGRVVAGVDARAGYVAAEGWAETTTLAAADLVRRMADAGIAAVLFTDIGRDGMLGGLNIEATLALAGAAPVPVIASGGVAGLEDLERLREAARTARGRIEGVVVGRALYEGRFTVPEALAALTG